MNDRSQSPVDKKVYNDLSQLLIAKNLRERKPKTNKRFVRGGGWSFIEEYDTPKRTVFRSYIGGSDPMSVWNRQASPVLHPDALEEDRYTFYPFHP